MLVFGDRVRVADPADMLAAIEARLGGCAAMPDGPERHDALTAALLDAGELAQGLADAARAYAGRDDVSADVDASMALVMTLAAAVLGAGDGVPAALALLRTVRLPPRVEPRTAEGFAFYAVYPEAYAVAARSVGGPARVLGLRSVGTVLAAMAATALDAPPPPTLRPVGHPFAREIAVSDRLARRILDNPGAAHLIADEGPGASGSSFAAAADWLERAGVPPERIVLLPSHPHPPGPMASAPARARWDARRRVVASCEPDARLADWFAGLLGKVWSVTDLSGGGWRRDPSTPCRPAFERRKFLLRTGSGDYLAKFAGLGRTGEAKLALARRLHAGGFIAEPAGLRHGFLAERWDGAATPLTGPPDLPVLARYLAFRARHCPAEAPDGASLGELCRMARVNTAERLGPAAAARLPLDPDLPCVPVQIDGRLHRWEWLRRADGRVLKTDALDHHAAHDLVGCQDIAWDIAGAIVEFDLTDRQTKALLRAVDEQAGRRTEPRLLATYVAAYCAFQLGLWIGAQNAAELVARYESRLLTPPQYPP